MRKLRFYKDVTRTKTLYDSEYHGPWTLNECRLSPPVRQTNIIEIPGRDGVVDLAPALGDVKYEPREFSAALECSEGTRVNRTKLIEELTNKLAGQYCYMELPDDPMHYIEGYVDVEVEYNDINHARIILTSQVSPWRVRWDRVNFEVEASNETQSVIIKNRGGRKVVPQISAWTSDTSMPDITLTCSTRYYEHTFDSWGAIYPEELAMAYGDELVIEFSGSGHLEFNWKEASL